MLFPAAINARNFPELEFEELVALANCMGVEDNDGVPLSVVGGGEGLYLSHI